MPATPENQAAYPQPPTQQPGLGFPLARVAVLLSLATGACHDLAIAPYAGKGTGETTLLRTMYGALKPGDVLLADALFDDYFLACELRDQRIDSTMQMDVLRCKTPEMVHKEIWAHLLAYNLLRTVMAVAAAENGIEPGQVSFKGAKQAVTAFAPKIEAARSEERAALIAALLTTIAYHRVGDRPGRWEPRARKRRPKPGARLMQPRATARLPQNRSKYY